MRFVKAFFDWLKEDIGSSAKRATRHLRPRIMAYWWDGGMPVSRELKNLSTTGAFLDTTERWYVGTIITLTLQQERDDPGKQDRVPSISLPCKVVRDGSDGVGVSFLFRGKEDRKAFEEFVQEAISKGPSPRAAGGQALIEFALTIPLLFLLVFSVVNFGAFIYAWITVANAARAAANYAALGGASAGSPTSATSAQIASLIATDTSSLPSAVNVCVNQNATASAATGTCSFTISSLPADPEAPSYASVAVDVRYTYTPLIAGFSFSLPAIIHRRTVMRVLN